MKKNEIQQYIGNESQIGCSRHYVLTDGWGRNIGYINIYSGNCVKGGTIVEKHLVHKGKNNASVNMLKNLFDNKMLKTIKLLENSISKINRFSSSIFTLQSCGRSVQLVQKCIGFKLNMKYIFTTLILFLCWGRTFAQITGGMLDPSIDKAGEPFSYFWHPTDIIGSLYAPVASEVTPEGYIYTGCGELMFFVDNPPEPVKQRVKTLLQGYLPVVQYQVDRHSIGYEFTMFAADIGSALEGLPVNFARVKLVNRSQQSGTAFLSTAWRFMPDGQNFGGKEYRFNQRYERLPKQLTEGQTVFNPNWQYSFSQNALVRDGRIIYLFPLKPAPYQKSLAKGDKGLQLTRFFTGEVTGNPNPKLLLDPQLQMGMVTYRLTLAPGETVSLDFKLPILPLALDSAAAQALRAADYDKVFGETVGSWKKLVAGSPCFRFPETKVQEALLANTMTILLAIDKLSEAYVMNVNKFQYHSPVPTDASLMNIALDDMGHQDITRKTLLYAMERQRPDGGFSTESGLLEAWGHVLWSWGRHYALTHDQDFLSRIYPAVLHAVEWEMKVTQKDSLGLLPASSVMDDAVLKNCHQTGQDLWALVGLRAAVRLAKGIGDNISASRFETEYKRFWQAFEKQLNQQTHKTGGYIPPSLDRTLLGNDWDNLHTLYPEPLFSPFDERVTASLHATRAKYREGILPYLWPQQIAKNEDGSPVFNTTPALHYFHTLDNAENALVRGAPEDQQNAVNDLYALLVHTTSTHATQEWGTHPWSTRDIQMRSNILPDGTTSAVMIELVRNMLVREQADELHLFSAVSPEWLQPGKTLSIEKASTNFGHFSATLTSSLEGLSLKIDPEFIKPPRQLVVHIPWFFEIREALVDGHRIQIKNGAILITSGVHDISLKGRIKPDTPPLSYQRAVEDYKREYALRYVEFIRTGKVDQIEKGN
jgi:hypothetical protein